MNESPVILAERLTKLYQRGRETVHALDGVSFEIARGEFVAITGPSGAGKTTLLNLTGCMDTPTSGALKICGRAMEQLGERERTAFRRDRLGFVFQHFGLIPTLTVAENVGLPAMFARRADKARVMQLVGRVGLAHRLRHRPHELSGGEMQRVAIARALVNTPDFLLADEPTGNLDQASGEEIINLFRQLNDGGLTIVVVTHNAAMAEAARRRIMLAHGRIVQGG
jgi:ABC-type lipoprotein export system ATPase subunit